MFFLVAETAWREWVITEIDFTKFSCEKKKVRLAVEKPLTLYINGKHYATFLVTPNFVKELVIGHLFSTGVISSLQDISSFQQISSKVMVELKRGNLAETERIYKLISTACGAIGKESLINEIKLRKIKCENSITVGTIVEVYKDANKRAETHKLTAGTHIAGAYTLQGKNVFFVEDIGRHNAIDKLIGLTITRKREETPIIVTSGRPTIDLVSKIVRTKTPFLISFSRPTHRASKLAEEKNLTLITIKKKIYLFSGKERVETN